MEVVNLVQFLQGLAFVVQTGLAGVILLVWRAEQRKNAELVEMLRETFRNLEKALSHLEDSLKLQQKTAESLCKSYEHFEQIINYNVASLSRIEQKVTDGVYCPILRKGGLFYARRDFDSPGQEGGGPEGA